MPENTTKDYSPSAKEITMPLPVTPGVSPTDDSVTTTNTSVTSSNKVTFNIAMQQAFPRKSLVNNEWTYGENLSDSKIYQDEKCMEKLISISASGNATHASQVLHKVIEKIPALKSSFVSLIEEEKNGIDSEIVDSVQGFMDRVSKHDATQAEREASNAIMTACTYSSKISIRKACYFLCLSFHYY